MTVIQENGAGSHNVLFQIPDVAGNAVCRAFQGMLLLVYNVGCGISQCNSIATHPFTKLLHVRHFGTGVVTHSKRRKHEGGGVFESIRILSKEWVGL